MHPLNIPEKLHWQHLFQKPEEAETIAFILVNTMQHPRILKNNIYYKGNGYHHHFFIWMPILCFATF